MKLHNLAAENPNLAYSTPPRTLSHNASGWGSHDIMDELMMNIQVRQCERESPVDSADQIARPRRPPAARGDHRRVCPAPAKCDDLTKFRCLEFGRHQNIAAVTLGLWDLLYLCPILPLQNNEDFETDFLGTGLQLPYRWFHSELFFRHSSRDFHSSPFEQRLQWRRFWRIVEQKSWKEEGRQGFPTSRHTR